MCIRYNVSIKKIGGSYLNALGWGMSSKVESTGLYTNVHVSAHVHIHSTSRWLHIFYCLILFPRISQAKPLQGLLYHPFLSSSPNYSSSQTSFSLYHSADILALKGPGHFHTPSMPAYSPAFGMASSSLLGPFLPGSTRTCSCLCPSSSLVLLQSSLQNQLGDLKAEVVHVEI